MRRPKLLYVHEYKDRHGKVRRYFRRPGYKRIPLPGLPGSTEFREAYEAALSGAERIEIGADSTSPGTLGAAVINYLQSTAFSILADETRRTRRSILQRLREEHGHRPLSGLTQERIQRLVDAKVGTPDAARNFLNALKAMMKHLKSVRLLAKDPTVGVNRPKIRSRGFHTWTEEEILRFENAHPIGSRARLAFALLLYTAQRRSDVARLGPQHRVGDTFHIRQRKTGTALDIPVHPELRAILDVTPTSHLTYLTTTQGKPFTLAGFGNWFRDCCNKAGLPTGVAAHGLRKAACRRLAEAGCDTIQIRAISGHRNLKELQIYVDAANQKRLAESAMATVVSAFPGVKKGTCLG